MPRHILFAALRLYNYGRAAELLKSHAPNSAALTFLSTLRFALSLNLWAFLVLLREALLVCDVCLRSLLVLLALLALLLFLTVLFAFRMVPKLFILPTSLEI